MLHATRINAIRTVPHGAAGPRIGTVSTPEGSVFSADVFVDGTYEGALLKLAGVSYTFGREANTTYSETAAGRLPTRAEQPIWPPGDRAGPQLRRIPFP